MNAIALRILSLAAGGAGGGIVHSLLSGPTIHVTLSSVFIGAISGAVAGAVASIPAPKLLQTILTGAAAGLSLGVLSYWLLGSSVGFGAHVFGALCGMIGSLLSFRYINPLFGNKAHRDAMKAHRDAMDSRLWAKRTNMSKTETP